MNHEEIVDTTPQGEVPLEETTPPKEDILQEATTVDTSEDIQEDSLEAEEAYFQEDEDILAGDDKVLHRSEALGVYQQLDNVVSWEVANFYDEEGKLRSPRDLRAEPPVFRITSSGGDAAEFVLTQELSRSMEEIFGNVRAGYFGVDKSRPRKSPLSQESLRETGQGLLQWAVHNKVKTALMVVLLAFLLVSFFL